MARTVQFAKIESPTARAKLARGRRYHFQSLISGRASLGYHRNEGAPHGRWVLQRYLGADKYARTELGKADDGLQADGVNVLDFEQAKAKALEMLSAGTEAVTKDTLTVRKAYAKYVEYLASQGKRTLETERRGAALILPELGDLKVAELTSERLRKWHSAIASRPAFLRSKADAKKRNTKAAPGTDPEAVRKRRSSANRILTMLKAALNHAYDEEWVSNNSAWGRRVKPFRDVDRARTRYLSVAEAIRLLNACEPSFRNVVQAALETGCRYGELCRLTVADFNPDAGTVTIRKSKSGKPRNVILSPEGVEFFIQLTVGRRGSEILLRNEARIGRALARERELLEAEGKNPATAKGDDTGEWRTAEQGRPMREACENGKIDPPISIHGMRHTWASLAVMNGVPLQIVAQNLGHAKDSRMVELHYSHLSPGFVAEAIRQGAPRFGFKADKRVATLRAV